MIDLSMGLNPGGVEVINNPLGLLGLPGGNFNGSTTLIHSGEVGDYWLYPWALGIAVQKTTASQLQDHAMMLRGKSTLAGDRLTVTVRTGGYINLRVRKGDGSLGREIETTAVAAVGDIVTVYGHWDLTMLSIVLAILHGSTRSVYTYSSSANVSLGADADPSGVITLGNNYGATPGAGVYPYIGISVAGGFKYGAVSLATVQAWAAVGYIPMDGEFQYAPAINGAQGTSTIKEPHGRDMTAYSSALAMFWGSYPLNTLICAGGYFAGTASAVNNSSDIAQSIKNDFVGTFYYRHDRSATNNWQMLKDVSISGKDGWRIRADAGTTNIFSLITYSDGKYTITQLPTFVIGHYYKISYNIRILLNSVVIYSIVVLDVTTGISYPLSNTLTPSSTATTSAGVSVGGSTGASGRISHWEFSRDGVAGKTYSPFRLGTYGTMDCGNGWSLTSIGLFWTGN